MGFNCGIVGLPNVGKSALFNALTATQAAEAAKYPFSTREANIGRVAVPDERLAVCARLAKSAKIIPTQLEFVDIAAHQPGDIDEFQLSRDDLGGFGKPRADRKTLVGHRDPTDIRLTRRERILRCLCRLGRGQRVEQGGLADIRQADDATVEAHRFTRAAPWPPLPRVGRGGAPLRS